MNRFKKNSGFSEIEFGLFIVLVAFIVVMVRTCKDYQEQYKIKSDIADILTYKAAGDDFKTKYGQLPGDFNNAKSIWPDCADDTNLKINCNGNGNGIWDNGEGLYVFEHLSKAGFINGSYKVVQDGATPNLYPTLGSTGQSVVPIGKLNKKAQEQLRDVFYGYNLPTNSLMFYFDSNMPGYPMALQRRIKHNVVETIDDKIDDGNAGTGDVRAAYDKIELFGKYPAYELCADSKGVYKRNIEDDLYCNFIVKY